MFSKKGNNNPKKEGKHKTSAQMNEIWTAFTTISYVKYNYITDQCG